MQNIEAIFQNSGKLHDRFFNETFQLPNNFETIKIQGNELCTHRAINDALDKLYDNFLYLYGLTKLGSNVVPEAVVGTYAVSGNVAQWNYPAPAFSDIQPFQQVGWGGLDNATGISVNYSETYSNYVLVINNSNVLNLCLTPGANTFNVFLSSANADYQAPLPFVNLTNTCFIGNYLYACDAYYNNIYRYNLDGVLTDDIYPAKLALDSHIGGYGVFQDRYKFNNPTCICSANECLFVLDAGNYCIKKYDKNLNNIAVYQYKKLFGTDKPLRITGDNHTGKILVITAGSYLYVFEPDFKTYETVDLRSFIGTGTIQDLFTSKAFNNCYYFVTNTSIYKMYLSKPGNQLGKYSLYRLGVAPAGFSGAASTASALDDTKDEVFILANNGTNGSIVHAVDSSNFLDVLSLPDFEVFTPDEVHVHPGEFTQTWVINKAIQKLLLNHLRFKDKIKGRFTGKYDEGGNPLLIGTLYFLLNDLDLTAYRITLDHFAGNNEVLASAVVNRGLEKIYNIQQAIIAKSNTILQTSSFFESQSVSID